MKDRKRESDIPRGRCCMSCGNWELIAPVDNVHEGNCLIEYDMTISIEGSHCEHWHTSVEFHVIPIDDLKEHSSDCDCECNPTIKHHDDDGSPLPKPIAVHRSWDCREAIEKAEDIINDN